MRLGEQVCPGEREEDWSNDSLGRRPPLRRREDLGLLGGRRRAVAGLLLAGAVLWPSAGRARDRAPGFFQQRLDLPGIPAAVVPAEMTGDGRDDLVVLAAYTGWTTRAEFEPAKFDDIEGLVEVMNVVDELVGRRELRLYPAAAEGDGFDEPVATLDLDATVHALATGHPAEPLVAVTDDGASAVRLEVGDEGARLTLTPLVTGETTFAGGGRFYPDLDLLHDLDGDSLPELLLPTAAGWAVHRGTAEGFAAEATAVITLPEPPREDEGEATSGAGEREDGSAAGRPGDAKAGGDSRGGTDDDSDSDSESDSDGDSDEDRPLHEIGFEVRDCNGDGRLDLLVPGGTGHDGPLIFAGAGDLAFAEAVEVRPGGDEQEREVMYIGDLEGDGEAEVVDRTELERYADPGWRQEVDEAKRPLFAYALSRLGADLVPAPEPYLAFESTGYTFGGSESDDDEVEVQLPGGFQDLDGDGRQDLVAITLEFSLLPMVMRVLVAQRISLTMNFHVSCQDGEGGFREVPGLDLSGRFKLNLRNLRVRHRSQFAGDFDGDGRADFVQLGRGRRVTIHQGRAGCRYPAQPDRSIRLSRKLQHLGLARVLDLDGDGRSDLYVVHPLKADDPEVSIPARVDIYLSRF